MFGKKELIIVIAASLAALILLFVLLSIFVFKPMKCKKMMRELDKKFDFSHALLIGQDAQYIKRLEMISRTNLLYVDTHTKFSRRYKDLRDISDIESSQLVYSAKDALVDKNYKAFKVNYKKAVECVNKYSDELNVFTNELLKVIKPEDDCRQSALEYKGQLRRIKQDYLSKDSELTLVADTFKEVFEYIDELFRNFEECTDSAHYDEANGILPKISEILHELTANLQELPSLCALLTDIVPEKIHSIESAYKILVEDKYPLHNLFVIQTIDTMRRNLDNYTKKIQVLDTKGVREDLDNMLQQLDDLELKFSKEKEAKIEFDANEADTYKKVNEIEKRFITLKNTIPEVSEIFIINEEYQGKLVNLQKDINQIGALKRTLDTYVHSNTKQPYSLLVKKISEIRDLFDSVFAQLDEFDHYLDSLKTDAESAYDAIYTTFDKVKVAEKQVRLMNLDATNLKYLQRIEKLYDLLDKINILLTTTPINIDEVNILVRELSEQTNILLDDGEIAQDYNMMVLAENAIMYGNKNRNNISEISALLNKAEEQFAAGEFMNANGLAKEALTKIKQTNGRR